VTEPPEIPYVIWEPKLGTFEYGFARFVNDYPIKNQLGTAFTMRAAKRELRKHGFKISGPPTLLGTRPAAERGRTQ
jgi:hypothetical protein